MKEHIISPVGSFLVQHLAASSVNERIISIIVQH